MRFVTPSVTRRADTRRAEGVVPGRAGAPDLEVHAFVNDVSRSTGAMVCGRRLHETMRYWDTAPTDADSSDAAASVTSASAGPPSRRRR